MTLYSDKEKLLMLQIQEAEREAMVARAKAEADRQFQMYKPILLAKLGVNSDYQRRKRLTHEERTKEGIDLVASRKHERNLMLDQKSDEVFDETNREIQKLAEKVDQKAGK